MTQAPAWREAPEVGSALGVRFVVALATLFGRRTAVAFASILAAYYVVASARTRRASRDYLARVGQPPGLTSVLRHVCTFATVAVDRVFLLRGDTRAFLIEAHDQQRLKELAASGRGALLLGSHLGSFEALGAAARDLGLPLSIVVDGRSAARLEGVLRSLPGSARPEIIAVDPSGVGTLFEVQRAVRAGRLVSILADRVTGREAHRVTVDVLGSPADLPAGPYLAAHTLGCPVVLVFGLYRGGRRYELHCEPFAGRLRLDRADRVGSLRAYAQRYAERLSVRALEAPYNWFNFYDFWRDP